MHKTLIGRILEAHGLDGSNHPEQYGWSGEGDTLVSSIEEYDSICRVHPDGRASDWITHNPKHTTPLYTGIATVYENVRHHDLRSRLAAKFPQPDFYDSIEMSEDAFWELDAVTRLRKIAAHHALVRVLDRYNTADAWTRITPYVLYTVEVRNKGAQHIIEQYQSPILDTAYEFFKERKKPGYRVELFRNDEVEAQYGNK